MISSGMVNLIMQMAGRMDRTDGWTRTACLPGRSGSQGEARRQPIREQTHQHGDKLAGGKRAGINPNEFLSIVCWLVGSSTCRLSVDAYHLLVRQI